MENTISPVQVLMRMLRTVGGDAKGALKGAARLPGKAASGIADRIEGNMRAEDEARNAEMVRALSAMGKTRGQYESDLGLDTEEGRELFTPTFQKLPRKSLGSFAEALGKIRSRE